MVGRQGHLCHTAHRMTDQDQRAPGRDSADDGVEVEPELVDLVGLLGPGSGATVASLIPEHDTVARLLEGSPLEHPAAQAQRVTVGEQHGRGGCAVGGFRLRTNRLVDLDMERYTVVGKDDDLL